MHIIHSLKYDELWKYNSIELSFILIEPTVGIKVFPSVNKEFTG